MITISPVLLTVLLSLTLSGCAWSCQPGIVLADSMSVKQALTVPAGGVDSLVLGCERRY